MDRMDFVCFALLFDRRQILPENISEPYVVSNKI